MNDKVFLQGGYRESRVILRRIVWKKKVWKMEYTFSNLYELLPSLSRDFRKLVNSYPLLSINLSRGKYRNFVSKIYSNERRNTS